MIDLEAIEARERKATKGPWGSDLNRTVATYAQDGEWGDSIVQVPMGVKCPTFQDHRNMDFIAYSREDIPALISEVRRLREALREIACFDDHPELDELMGLGHLDEPGAASIAREALKEKK